MSHAGSHRYVQIAFKGDDERFVTIRARPDADSERLIGRLTRWLAQPEPLGHLLDVG
jgi:hypothetical protein